MESLPPLCLFRRTVGKLFCLLKGILKDSLHGGAIQMNREMGFSQILESSAQSTKENVK